MSKQLDVFDFGGIATAKDPAGLINLNGVWSGFGSPKNKDPRQWIRLPSTVSLMESLARNLNVEKSHIWKSRRGKSLGGTWAHSTIAVAYAEYVSDEAHIAVIEAFKAWVAEEADPGLKIERGVEGARRKGWSENKIRTRFDGIMKRNTLTDTLKDHDVEGAGYAVCTDQVNVPILGCTAAEFKKRNNIPAKAKTRDHLPATKLSAIGFAESMAATLIARKNASGISRCAEECRRASEAAATAMKSLGLDEEDD